jgi:hypothetical protein
MMNPHDGPSRRSFLSGLLSGLALIPFLGGRGLRAEDDGLDRPSPILPWRRYRPRRGPQSGATATGVISSGPPAITMTYSYGGSGYTSPPTVTFSGGGYVERGCRASWKLSEFEAR